MKLDWPALTRPLFEYANEFFCWVSKLIDLVHWPAPICILFWNESKFDFEKKKKSEFFIGMFIHLKYLGNFTFFRTRKVKFQGKKIIFNQKKKCVGQPQSLRPSRTFLFFSFLFFIHLLSFLSKLHFLVENKISDQFDGIYQIFFRNLKEFTLKKFSFVWRRNFFFKQKIENSISWNNWEKWIKVADNRIIWESESFFSFCHRPKSNTEMGANNAAIHCQMIRSSRCLTFVFTITHGHSLGRLIEIVLRLHFSFFQVNCRFN